MRVLLDQPEGWRVDRKDDWTLFSSPDKKLHAMATPLSTPSGLDPRKVFERDVAPGLRVEYLGADETKHTRSGWAMTVTNLRIVDANGEERERRVGALYHMLMYVGAVVVRVTGTPSSTVIVERGNEIAALLASARPHLWSSTSPSCVAELFVEDP
ncbi:MAG: hypothetical protein ACKV2T_07050 [Kofleriaceae bacterium]